MIPLCAIMTVGLSGCAGNPNRVNVNDMNQNPVGYYSNENHRNGLGSDNDGPITEWADHTLGAEGKIQNNQRRMQLQTRDEKGNPPNPTKPLATTDRNMFERDNRFSTSDMNYHGHLNRQIGNAGIVTDPKFQDNVTDKIRKKVRTVKNVKSVRSVAYGNTIIVSVNLNDKRKATETKKAIQSAVMPYADGKPITVLTDEGVLGRDRNFNNDIQRGGPR
jgi:spore cortex protein